MRFSTKGEYGLRLAVNLSQNYPVVTSLKSVAETEKISLKYLERIIAQLKKKKIVKSSQGKNGGYILARSPQKISAGEIIEAMEGPFVSKCFHTNCKNVKKCASSFVWIKLGTQIKKTLYGIKLADLKQNKNDKIS